MTDSIMRCYGSLIRLVCCGLFLLLAAQAVLAADISIRGQALEHDEEGYALTADFNINFNSRLEDAVSRGIVLYFTIDFELSRDRWYWFDEQVVRRSRTYRLYYHALTRQYRLSTGALHQNYASLEEALRVMSRLRNWQVLDGNQVTVGQIYVAGLRMYLDLSQMPKTFQVSALANKDWNLASDPLYWNFTPSEPVAAKASESSVGEIK